ncbi:hypothetical protein AB1A65_12185 [Muricauda sp. ANG21]|uniref:hypothetical protein n=1 Tax=Allomuricauda sp. ANG21 TaxID=3042468 RepID=UPI003456E4A0
MKKFLLFSLAVLFGSTVAKAQFQAGISGGLPLGDAGDLTTFAIAVDLGYLFDLSDDVHAGPAIGYSHSFGDKIDTGIGTVEIEDIKFLPVSGGIIFDASDDIGLGLNLGYALGINDGNDGGFYYSPRVSFSLSNSVDLFAAYRGISRDGGSFDMVTLGVEFGFE